MPPQMFNRNEPGRSSRALLTGKFSQQKRILNCDATSYADLYTGGQLIADKTPFLKQLYLMPKMIRITLPRRMGKTILLTMAKSFFELPGGQRYGLGGPNYNLFKDTLIFKEEREFAESMFGKIPTIFFSMFGVYGENYKKFIESLALAVQAVYENFRYLKERDEIDGGQRKFIKKVLDSPNNLSNPELQMSLQKLSKILNGYHGEKVLIIIDEYDYPVNTVGRDVNMPIKDRQKILAFHQRFLEFSFKDNDYMYKGIVSGIMRVNSSLTYKECNLGRQNQLSRYFGFSANLVEDLASKLETIMRKEIEPGHLDLAKEWFNGYFFDTQNREECFYNPYSMSKFFFDYNDMNIGALQCHWSLEGETVRNIANALKKKEIASKVEILLKYSEENEIIEKGGNFFQKLIENFTSSDYEELAKLCQENYTVNDRSIQVLFSFLCHMGFIALRNGVPFIPNNEGKIFMRDIITDYYVQRYAFDARLTDAVTDELVKLVHTLENDPLAKLKTAKLKDVFQNFLQAPGIIDQLFDEEIPCEGFAHAMLSYITSRMYSKRSKALIHDKSFTIVKDGQPKSMRPDLAFDISKTKTIIEMKYHKNGDAKEAVKEAKYYQFKLFNSLRSDIEHRIFLGIHVAKKGDVTIVSEYQDGKTISPEMDIPEKFKE